MAYLIFILSFIAIIGLLAFAFIWLLFYFGPAPPSLGITKMLSGTVFGLTICALALALVTPALSDSMRDERQALVNKLVDYQQRYYRENHQHFTDSVQDLAYFNPDLIESDGRSVIKLFTSPDKQKVRIQYKTYKLWLDGTTERTISAPAK